MDTDPETLDIVHRYPEDYGAKGEPIDQPSWVHEADGGSYIHLIDQPNLKVTWTGSLYGLVISYKDGT